MKYLSIVKYLRNHERRKLYEKKRIAVALLIVLFTVFLYIPVEAAQKNVTNTYKQKATKILRGFDSYFGYCCGKKQYFKYDAYARTTMVYLKNYRNIYGKSTAYAKKKMLPQMKLYFNSSTVKLKKYTSYKFPTNPSYLIQNQKGKLTYVGGDWGECIPRGIVKKVIQKGSDYEVIYDICLYDPYLKKYVKDYRKNIRQTYSAKTAL